MISDQCWEARQTEWGAQDKMGYPVVQSLLGIFFLNINRLLSSDENLESEIKLETLTPYLISGSHFLHCTFAFVLPKFNFWVFFLASH